MAEDKVTKVDYHDWIEGEGLERICEWIRHGLTDKQIASNIGIAQITLYQWQHNFPEFADAIKKAKIQPNIELENAMFNLACGKTFVEEVKSVLDPKNGTILKIEKTRKQIPPSAILLIFLAKNRMRDKYRDYAPTPSEAEGTGEPLDVKIYLPDNGRGMNDSQTAGRSSGEVLVN